MATVLLLPGPVAATWVVARAAKGVPSTFSLLVPEARRGGPRYQLVTMPINHFGEKLRWCIDLMEVDYVESTVGGLTSGFFRGRSVPWLVDRAACSRIGNSDEAL